MIMLEVNDSFKKSPESLFWNREKEHMILLKNKLEESQKKMNPLSCAALRLIEAEVKPMGVSYGNRIHCRGPEV